MSRRTRRASILLVAFGVTALLGLSGAVLYALHGRTSSAGPRHSGRTAPATPSPSSSSTSAPSVSPQPGEVDSVELAQSLDRMRHLSLSTKTTEQLIDGEATTQPDLFAAEFVRRLLTQDYTTPRASLLAWVQAESTPTADPLVVGLVPPDLRDRLAVYSVTDASDGPAPVPTDADWATFTQAHGSTTVRIDRVVEPTAWSGAVEAGRVTDPGTTARLVAATVTRHTTVAGHRATKRFSVAVTLNIEGPPTQHDWRFVAVVTYTSLPMGGAS